MSTSKKPFVVIVAGGTGTRLWPLSKKNQPKQFLDLFGEGSFIKSVYQRVKLITDIDKIFIVAPGPYSVFFDQYLPEFPKQNFMAEPEKKGTTAAYGYTAIYIKQIDPDAVIHVLAADDYIKDNSRYQRMLEEACTIAAEQNELVIYGAKPRYPYSGYGYIQVDIKTKKNHNDIDTYQVKSFHEKPEISIAENYLRQGDYFWHCFGFTVRVSRLLEIIAKYDPATYAVLGQIEADLKLPSRLEEFNLTKHYSKLIESNIENKILENLDQTITMVTMEDSWSDVGSWDHVFEIASDKMKLQPNGNIAIGDASKIFLIDSLHNLVRPADKPICLVGVKDLVVVATDTVILICSRQEAQKVKKMVNLLKEGHSGLL